MSTVLCLELNAPVVATCVIDLSNIGPEQIIKVEICGQGVLSLDNYFRALRTTAYNYMQ